MLIALGVGLLVALGACLYFYLSERKDSIPLALLFGVLSFAATTLFVALPLSHFAPTEWVKTGQSPLVAFADHSEIQGEYSMFLLVGSGSVGETSRYFYYYETPRGSIRQGWVTTSYAEIFEFAPSPGGEPRVEYWEEQYVGNWDNLGLFKANGWSRAFYVPEGTVVRDFRADLE